MNMRTSSRALTLFSLAVAVLVARIKTSSAADLVAGNLIQFNENGAWCWYQDPRLVIDKADNTVLISSVANSEGVDGDRRAGDVDVVAFHPDTGARSRYVLHHGLQPQDDHNVAALLIRPDGRYLAMYSRHNYDHLSYWRVSTRPHDAGDWGPERTFDWTDAILAAGAASRVTYSNLFYLPAEGRTYDFTRAINDDPSILVSPGNGDQWSCAGKLLTEQKLGYVNGYTKYASNGADRIDFITTEHHPRDFNNSIYHGYVQGGKLHRSDGTVVEDDLFKSPGHPQTELTPVFAANTLFDGTIMTHAWTISLAIDGAGRPYGLISARADDQPEDSNFSDHRFFYVRYDGKQWRVHQLAKAGACLWPAEQDYTGLAALNPSDPNVVYVSTTVDPRNDSPLDFHEIFRGRTADGGGTWSWSPITQNSSVDNLRPLMVAWDGDNSLLVWFRGTMSRSQNYDTAIVGTLLRNRERMGKIQYLPAPSLAATASPDGSDARVKLPRMREGTYDLFAFFWSEPADDQTISAGLAADQRMIFRPRSAQQAEASQFSSPVKVEDGNRLLYRAFIGRMQVKAGQPVDVFVDQKTIAGLGFAEISPS
jgi:hypothetical protein